jgi:NAD(P)H-dependent flavin oxidoreductase YrpB (nitropropane dioxygenase family)
VLFKEEFIMSIKIGDVQVELPIIQGGMAIRASMSRLAAAVANEGGIGLIAGTALSTEELKDEIKKAKDMIKNKGGALGVNIMFAANNFIDLVKASINAGADLIVFGAGFSRDVFEVGKEAGVPIVPIVSSLKLAKISQKLGASAIIVEGGNAGGHLGTDLDSWDIVGEIAEKITVPVFGAGGVITPEDARRMLDLGVDGIQMGSRFIASDECEVSDEFKQMYINSKEGDVVQIMSSAGLPANAIISPYVEKILKEEMERPTTCTGCLKKCTKTFCVNERLVKGHEGNYEEGIFFAGKDAWKIDEVLSVKEIMKRFKEVF